MGLKGKDLAKLLREMAQGEPEVPEASPTPTSAPEAESPKKDKEPAPENAKPIRLADLEARCPKTVFWVNDVEGKNIDAVLKKLNEVIDKIGSEKLEGLTIEFGNKPFPNFGKGIFYFPQSENITAEEMASFIQNYRYDALQAKSKAERVSAQNGIASEPVQPETPTATPDVIHAPNTSSSIDSPITEDEFWNQIIDTRREQVAQSNDAPYVQPEIPGMPPASAPATPDVSPEPTKQPETATAPQRGYSKRFNLLDDFESEPAKPTGVKTTPQSAYSKKFNMLKDFPPIKPAPEPKSALRKAYDATGKYITDAIGGPYKLARDWREGKEQQQKEVEAERARQEAEAEARLSPEEKALKNARKKYVEALKNKKGSQFDLVNAESTYEEAKVAYGKTFANPGEGVRKITIDEYQAFKNEEVSQLPLRKRNFLKELGYGALSEWSKIPRWRRMAYSSFFLTAGSYAYGSITAGALAGTFATRVTRSVASMLIGQFGGKQYEKIDEEKIEEKKVGLHIIKGRITNTKDISPEVIRDLEKEYKERFEALSIAQRKAQFKKALIMGILGAGATSWWKIFESGYIPEGIQLPKLDIQSRLHPHSLWKIVASQYGNGDPGLTNLGPGTTPAGTSSPEDLIAKWKGNMPSDVFDQRRPSTFEPVQPASSLQNPPTEPSPSAPPIASPEPAHPATPNPTATPEPTPTGTPEPTPTVKPSPLPEAGKFPPPTPSGTPEPTPAGIAKAEDISVQKGTSALDHAGDKQGPLSEAPKTPGIMDHPNQSGEAYEQASKLGDKEGIWNPVKRQLELRLNDDQAEFLRKYNVHAHDNNWRPITEDELKGAGGGEFKKDILNRETARILHDGGFVKANGEETWIKRPGVRVRLFDNDKVEIEDEESVAYTHKPQVVTPAEQATTSTPEHAPTNAHSIGRNASADAEVPPNEHVPGRRMDYSESTPAQTTPADYHYQGEESYLGNHDDALATQELHTGSPAQAPAPESAPQTQQPETTSGTRSFRPSAPEATNPALSGEVYINRIPGLRNLADGLHIKTEQMPLFGKIPMGTFLKTIPSYEANAEYYTTKTPFEFVLGQESVIVPPTKEFVSLIETMRELEPPEGYQNLAFEDLLKQKGDAFWNLYAQKLEFLQNTLH